ncbi:hypothetical protein STPH2_7501 [Streptomyces sp. KO7888]|nr:hypothetical protein [Streptomyces sp. KO7888]
MDVVAVLRNRVLSSQERPPSPQELPGSSQDLGAELRFRRPDAVRGWRPLQLPYDGRRGTRCRAVPLRSSAPARSSRGASRHLPYGLLGPGLEHPCTPTGPVPPKARHDAPAPDVPGARVSRTTPTGAGHVMSAGGWLGAGVGREGACSRRSEPGIPAAASWSVPSS